MLERIKLRLTGESVSDDLLTELLTTIKDRLMIRLGVLELPQAFESVTVDATVKAYRRLYYEGITNENVDSLSTSFVEDILNEYAEEIVAYKESQANSGNSERVVHFI